MVTTVPARDAIPIEETWNRESVFTTLDEWQNEYDAVLALAPQIAAYQGRLGEGAETLAELMTQAETLQVRAITVMFYAVMDYSVDTTNAQMASLYEKAQMLMGQVMGSMAFIEPEILALGQETALGWCQQNDKLTVYTHWVQDLFRRAASIRSADVEQLLGQLATPFAGAEQVHSMLTNADMQFPDAHDAQGNPHTVTQGTLDTLLRNPDREVRRTAWEGYADQYLQHKNTLATTLSTSMKQTIFTARARGFENTLQYKLNPHNLPESVFHNLVETFREYIPVWHRYWRVRRKALGVDQLHPYDIWAPLTKHDPRVSYEEAVEWISTGLQPLGADYVQVLRRGTLEQRWVDRAVNKGKREGAFSFGTPNTHPFIMMSYDNTLGAMSTLAHELGHSLHTYHSVQNQPLVYAHYSLFLAEIASNFNQALTRAYLLENNPDPLFQIAVIEEAMDNFHRYFFIMPSLARFEYAVHSRLERGEPVNADDMINLLTEIFSEGYGEEMQVDPARVGITWAQFSHLYEDYYVFQYATGISAAHHFANRILNDEPGAVEAYLGFLSAGSSAYPLDVLDAAGVDMRSPNVVHATFGVLDSYIDRLENLVDAHLT
ncbi:MAG: oligoendopeptidase F [Anaerolineales bacterium]